MCFCVEEPQALELLAPTLYKDLRLQAWDRNGSRSSLQDPEQTPGAGAAECCSAEAAGKPLRRDAVQKCEDEPEEGFSVEAHVAKEAGKATAYLHGPLHVSQECTVLPAGRQSLMPYSAWMNLSIGFCSL